MDENKMQAILWRLFTDEAFRSAVMQDANTALADQNLSEEEKAFVMNLVNQSVKVEDFASVVTMALEKRDSSGFVNIG